MYKTKKNKRSKLEKKPVVLTYTEEEAALLFDLLNSEMEELMSLNTKNKLSKEPIFDQNQVAYLHKCMDFCAAQLKVLMPYAELQG